MATAAVGVVTARVRRLGLPSAFRRGPAAPGDNETRVIVAILTVQAVSAALFIANIGFSVLGITPFAWVVHEITEIGAAVGLVLGTVLGGLALRRGQIRTRKAEAKLRAASGAFVELLEERFAAWGLTPAERDVALFAIKGMSTGEIAGLRQTSEGTVKAQTAAIYRKAGVTGRPQLLSLFIEDLMAGPVEGRERLKASRP
jgi:DNA-binding CsgD family transcriptional regulator